VFDSCGHRKKNVFNPRVLKNVPNFGIGPSALGIEKSNTCYVERLQSHVRFFHLSCRNRQSGETL